MTWILKSIVIISIVLLTSHLQAADSDSLELANMHQSIWSTFLFNNPDSAFSLAQAHLLKAQQTGNLYFQAKAFNTMGVSYSIRGNYESASKYYLKSLDIREKLNDIRGVASCLGNIGLCFQFQGRYEESVQYFTQSLEKYELIQDIKGIGDAFNNIGLVNIELEDYKEAQVYFQKALDNYEKVNMVDQQVIALTNIAVCYVDEGAMKKALGIYQKALNLNGEVNNGRNQSLIYSQMGNALLLSGLLDSAVHVLDKGLKITIRTGDTKHKGAILFYMGKTYLAKGDSIKAQIYLTESLELSKNIAASNTKIAALKLLATIYSSNRDYQQAYEYIQLHSNLNDSLRNNEVSRAATRSKFQYEYDKKRALDDQMRTEQRERELLIRYFLLTIVVIVAIFVVLLYLRYKLIRKQKNVIGQQAEELISTNKRLVELDKFKESMTHMVVHDFKNSINTVMNAEDSEKVKEAGRNMNNLVMNMLDVQRYENTKVELKFVQSNIETIVDESIDQIQYNLEQKGITVTKRLHNVVVDLDHEAIVRVLVNLLTNATKFSSMNQEIIITSDIVNEQFELSVSDSGIGISPEDIGKIFDKYISIDELENTRSTGLGLAYCKMIIEAHDGWINVESVKGQGTTFKIMFPRHRLLEHNSKGPIKENDIAINLPLQKEDMEYLSPFIKELRQFQIFEYSRIKEVLSRIQGNQKPALNQWIKKMESILRRTDENAYRAMVAHSDIEENNNF